MIDGTALGASGRTVRCGACGHSWHQLPEPEMAEPGQEAPFAAPPEAVTEAGAPLSAEPAGALAPPPIPPAEPAPPPAGEPAAAPAAAAAEESRRGRRREKAAAPKRGRGLTRVLVWFLFVFVVAALLLGGYKYRNDVVRLWPPAIRLYELLKIDTDPPSGVGLRVPPETLRFNREAEGGMPILVVSGEILNESKRAQKVTPMRILLLDKEGRVLRAELVKFEDRTLDPGKRMPFRTSIPNAPPEAAAARITFDLTGG
mgnify:CR=1 FL=1